MNTGRELNYRLYVQKMGGFTRMPFSDEMARYIDIQQGNVETVKERFDTVRKNFSEGKGTLSEDPVRNLRYHLIVSAAVISRVCAAGGMSHDEAYTLADIYIRRSDKCNDYEKMMDIFSEMRLDYAERMRDLKKSNVISIHIRKCIDYIYDHLHDDLSLNKLSEVVGLESTYLSKLFSKETGTPIKRFIIKAKVNTAENLLKFSDHSSSEIAFALGFSSQSAFISVFRKETGMTPKHYRDVFSTHEIM